MAQNNKPKPDALLIADTDATQSYVFESNKLPEIRGASRQLDDLNQEIGRLVTKQPGNQLIYAGGGGLLALVQSAQAADLVEEIEQYYPARTGVATITVDWRPLPEEYQDDLFGSFLTWGRHWLNRKKESKEPPPFIEALPFQMRCRSCQKRPAAAQYLQKLPDWPICSICYGKRTYTQSRRYAWFTRFEKWLEKQPEYNAHQEYRYHVNQKQKPNYPQAIDEIGNASHSANKYPALIYLDGDHIGQILKKLEKRVDFRKFSRQMQEITRVTVYHALATYLQPTRVAVSDARLEVEPRYALGDEVLIHPFEIITIGGDDVLLIVPAHAALPIAAEISQIFGDQMSGVVDSLLPEGGTVSMSGGIVIAENHTPIQVLVDIAKQLLREAKSAGGGRLDFHILKSADMLDRRISSIRSQYPYLFIDSDPQQTKLRLLARPYTHQQLKLLWQGLQTVQDAGLAASQVHLLAEALLDGRSASTLFYQYQRQRHGQQDRQSAHDRLESTLASLQQTRPEDPLPWQKVFGQDYGYQTALWDLAELYDFVP